VRQLSGIALPNYVLQFDARYRPMWDYYLRLVRQQNAEDEAWRWRRRVWTENCLLATLAALGFSDRSASGTRADWFLHFEQVQGRFIDVRAQIGSCEYDVNGHPWRLDLLDTRPLIGKDNQPPELPCMSHPAMQNAADSLLAMQPDFMIVAQSALGDPAPRFLLVWCLLDFALDEPSRTRIQERQKEFMRRISAFRSLPTRGLIILPTISAQVRETNADCDVLELPLPLQRHHSHIGQSLLRLLGGDAL
jgi:hypothetical protein